jgi:NAD(P)-dependent dehydrogenase (short-subunit alcohol dehydrogenase family)
MVNHPVLDTPPRFAPSPAPSRVSKLTRDRWSASLAMIGALLLSACAAGGTVAQEAPKPDWSSADIPSQAGRIFVVTGGTSGIGLETAKALAAADAEVIIAARNPQRGEEAIASIRQDTPRANVRFESLDLGNLSSVHAFGARLTGSLPHLDGLINNAGIMEPPQRATTPDGFESQFAINYLGHFALTADLLPLLRKSTAPRVVTLSSIAARRGGIHFDDLQFAQEWDATAAYQQSKLACLMFALELQRRSDAQGWGIASIASHPGLSRTNLLPSQGRSTPLWRFFQTAEKGAVPTLYAATAKEAKGGSYYGPTGLLEVRGALGLARAPEPAANGELATRLWVVSETLSGVSYPASSAE